WYTETGERLGAELELVTDPDVDPVPMQLLPSGPGYLTIPNLRLFTGLVHRAQEKLSLTSPYFVPDDSLLEAITTAAYRGVAVELSYRSRPTNSWSSMLRPLTTTSCWRQACGSTCTPS